MFLTFEMISTRGKKVLTEQQNMNKQYFFASLFHTRQSRAACFLLPVPNPAGVTVRALAMNGVAVVTVFAGGTHFLAVFAKEALGAELVTPRPIPASVAGDAASLCHLAGLLALAVPTPVVSQRKEKKNSQLSCFHKSPSISSKCNY